MDRSVLARVERLERCVDIGDVRNDSLESLEAYRRDLLGYRPSTKELARYLAEEKAAKEPKK